ncbi:hypothetical protein [Domibacillus tundrae]|uniref:hypothetical protein n=1 Tax=Domibacillus tundrae TaxID=1587527 RepID=UPI00339A1105
MQGIESGESKDFQKDEQRSYYPQLTSLHYQNYRCQPLPYQMYGYYQQPYHPYFQQFNLYEQAPYQQVPYQQRIDQQIP